MEIDLTKYAGHTPGPWKGALSYQWVFGPSGAAIANFNFASAKQENVSLIEDAPALLDEVVRLRADLAEAIEAMHVLAEHADLSDDSKYSTLGTKFVRSIIAPVLAKHGGGK